MLERLRESWREFWCVAGSPTHPPAPPLTGYNTAGHKLGALTPLRAEQAKCEEALLNYNALVGECEAVRVIYNSGLNGQAYAGRYIDLKKQIAHWQTRLQIAEAKIKALQEREAAKKLARLESDGLPILPP